MKETAIIIVAILAIAGLTFYALSQGHNSAIVSTSFTIIGGLAGYQVGKRRKPKA